MFKYVAILAVASMVFFAGDVQQAHGQYVTTYYAPAPAVPVVPVRHGLFGLRTSLVPVAPVTTVYSPARVYSQTVAYSTVVPTCHTHFRSAPVATVTLRPVVPVYRTFYSPW